MRANREFREMRYKIDNTQENYGEQHIRETRGGLAQSFTGSQNAGYQIGYLDERGSLKAFGS